MSTPKPNAYPVQLRLIIAEPPDNTQGEFGIQDRNQSLHTGQLVDGGLALECTIEAVFKTESVDFRGPFVHGPVGDRFVYLAWRRPEGTWIRRMKVELGGLTSGLIKEGAPLVAQIQRIDSSRAKLQTSDWRIE